VLAAGGSVDLWTYDDTQLVPHTVLRARLPVDHADHTAKADHVHNYADHAPNAGVPGGKSETAHSAKYEPAVTSCEVDSDSARSSSSTPSHEHGQACAVKTHHQDLSSPACAASSDPAGHMPTLTNGQKTSDPSGVCICDDQAATADCADGSSCDGGDANGGRANSDGATGAWNGGSANGSARRLVCVGIDDDIFFQTLLASFFESCLAADMDRSCVMGTDLPSVDEVVKLVLHRQPSQRANGQSKLKSTLADTAASDASCVHPCVHPDLIVLDQNLGKQRGVPMHGSQIAERLTHLEPAFSGVVVLLTGSSPVEQAQLECAPGVDLIMEKGCSPAELSTRIWALRDAKARNRTPSFGKCIDPSHDGFASPHCGVCVPLCPAVALQP